DLCGFEITDFANHDDIGVLAQDGAQCICKGQINSGIDLCLADAWQVILDRVFDCQNIGGRSVQAPQRRIQGGGLATSGWACYQEDAVGLPDQGVEALQDVWSHAQSFEFESSCLLVQQTQHGPLSMPGRQGRDPHIYRPPPYPQRNSAVLRKAFFGDVEVGHDLDAGNQCIVQGPARIDNIAQGAVYPIANYRMGFEWLDMYVTGAVPCCLREQCIDHSDDRCVVAGFKQVFNFGNILHETIKVHFICCSIDDLGCVAGLCISSRQQCVQLVVTDRSNGQGTMATAYFGQCPGWGPFGDGQCRARGASLDQTALGPGPGVRQARNHGDP